MRRGWTAVALALLVAACGGGDPTGTDPVDDTVMLPETADFCSVFNGEYDEALRRAVPVGDPAFEERASAIVAWAEALATLAPEEIVDEARDNLSYHEALAAIESAAEFIPGSNAMHAWAVDNC
jgi:hypothetical protein